MRWVRGLIHLRAEGLHQFPKSLYDTLCGMLHLETEDLYQFTDPDPMDCAACFI